MHCPQFVANTCRSCSEILSDYDVQLQRKQQACEQALSAQENIHWLPVVRSVESGFRNKAKMAVSGSFDAPVLGIVDAASHGTDLSDCALYPTQMQACFAPIKAFISNAKIQPYDIVQRTGELKFVLLTRADHSGDLMLRFVLRSLEPVSRIRKFLPELLAEIPQLKVVSINLQPQPMAITEGPEELLLTQASALAMRLNDIPMYLRPQSFFQTNSAVAAVLYQQVRDWVADLNSKTVWDLYCGVGGFALHCAAPDRQVLGVEISEEAVLSAQRSAQELSLPYIEFQQADASEFIAAQTIGPECLIVNPPRRGIGTALCEAINRLEVPSVIYSSCNVQSLAKDLQQLPGYQITQARLLDMFPHTQHFEVLVLLERKVG